MTTAQILDLQRRIGFAGADVDGFWGPKSVARCQAYLRGMMPHPHPWPAADSASLARFYGDPAKGEVSDRLTPLYVTGLGVQYDGKPVSVIRCHSQVAESLYRVLKAIAESPHAALLKTYAGVYNHRPMRGGNRWSLHAYGAAIDLDPSRNGLTTHWPTRASMPIDVMELFAREGWLPAGAFWSRDAMHFQATR